MLQVKGKKNVHAEDVRDEVLDVTDNYSKISNRLK